MGGKQAELRGRQRFGPKLRVDAAVLDFRRRQHSFQAIAQNFTPLSAAEMKALRDRAKPYAGDGRFELYKTSIKFDNPEARLAHEFPIDMQQAEVKQMVYATQNSGRPFPQVSE